MLENLYMLKEKCEKEKLFLEAKLSVINELIMLEEIRQAPAFADNHTDENACEQNTIGDESY